jgi:hypothetical protein
MRVRWGRSISIIVGSIVMVAGFLTGSASAVPVQTGSLSFSGDPGDSMSAGQSYSYDTQASDEMRVVGSGNNTVHVYVEAADGATWDLTMVAPQGRSLTAGTYTGATIATGEPSDTPELSLEGEDRWCETVTGSFTIDDIQFGTDGYVQTLDATWEQHCNGADAALRGEVHIANPPQPPPVPKLRIGMSVSAHGTITKATGDATVHGSVTCNQAVDVWVSGYLTQTAEDGSPAGHYYAEVPCTPGGRVAWTATAHPDDASAPFHKGEAQAGTQAEAWIGDYDVRVIKSKVVTLKKTK